MVNFSQTTVYNKLRRITAFNTHLANLHASLCALNKMNFACAIIGTYLY